MEYIELTGIKDIDNIINDYSNQLIYAEFYDTDIAKNNYKKVMRQLHIFNHGIFFLGDNLSNFLSPLL